MPTSRDVKEAFVLGNVLKGNWSDYEAFKKKFQQEKTRIASLPNSALNELITDKKRLLTFDTATLWEFQEIALDLCSVWPHMGSRKFIKGSVAEAASLFQIHGKDDDRLHRMTQMAKENWFAGMPIILFRRKKCPNKYRIDDGSNRAVAHWLAGIHVVNAYVGTVRADLIHKW